MELNQSIENPLGAGTQVGQGEAFVYTPNQNVFSTIQTALNQNLALKQADLKEKQEEKKKQDAELMKIMADIQVDSKWDKSLEEMSKHIDNVGDLVYSWRASGKPIGVEFYTKLNKEIARQNQLKGMNEKTFDQYTKLMTDLSTNKDVDQNEVKLWLDGFDKQKNIEGRFDYMNSVPKPNEDFNTLKLFKDNMSEDIQKNNKTFTDEAKQKKAEKAIFDNMSQYEKARTISKYSKIAGKALTEAEALEAIHNDLQGWYIDRTATVSTGRGERGPSANKPRFTVGVQYPDTSKDANGNILADTIALSTETMRDVPPAQFTDATGRQVTILPSKLVFSGTDWLIRGQEVGGKETFKSANKAEVDAFLQKGVQDGTIADASQVTQDANGEFSFNYTKLKQVDVPYLQNKEIFMNKYGFDPYIEADKYNKSRSGQSSSSSSSVNANTYQQ